MDKTCNELQRDSCYYRHEYYKILESYFEHAKKEQKGAFKSENLIYALVKYIDKWIVECKNYDEYCIY